MVERTALSGPSVWLGRDMVDARTWLREFDARALEEIDIALQAVKQRNPHWDQVRREDFATPAIVALMDDVAEELENGSGIVKLRTLPVDKYSDGELRQIYFGLGCVLGRPVFQNPRGEKMRDIRDEGGDLGRRYGQIETGDGKGPFLSSYARTLSNGRLRFHTDRTDVVGLLCVRQAAAGGVSKLVSTGAIHNALLERRPDILETLFGDFWRSRLGEESDTADAVYPLPIFGLRQGKLTSHYSLTYIEAAQMVPEVPRLTPLQQEAIDVLMATAEELCFEMVLEPGDMQFINSHVTYHGRTAFTDDAANRKDRLLLRLWLSMPNCRALPHGHEVLWGNIEAGQRRGGIGQRGAPAG
ncbi:MAG: TauD/TfdA family dioxygenase [Reyranellaceae bacterium]